MKLRDLEKYMKATNEYNKFVNNKKVLKVSLYDRTSSIKDCMSIKELIKLFNKEYYGNISMDNEVISNNDDSMTLNVKYEDRHINFDTNKWEYETIEVNYDLYIHEEREW